MKTHTSKLANPDAGMNQQAALLLKAMSYLEVMLPDGYFICTYPYSNCREMGFCLSLFRGIEILPMNIVFFEHRNSDELCAIQWEGTLPMHGGISVKDIPEKNYPDKWTLTKTWANMQFNEAITWTLGQIAVAIATNPQKEKE